MKSDIFERVKILFFGDKLSHVVVICVSDNQIETQIIKPGGTEGDDEIKIMGIAIQSESFVKKRVMDAIKKHSRNNVSHYYFYTKKKKHIHAIKEIIEELSLGSTGIYGIDPDFYYSLVPLNGKNYKLMEKYIINMKNDFSIKGVIKNMIKRVLINMNFSGKLYEGFVVIGSHGATGPVRTQC